MSKTHRFVGLWNMRNSNQMPLQLWFSGRGNIAHLAFKWLFTRVCSSMIVHIVRIIKYAITKIAWIRSEKLARMLAHVLDQCTFATVFLSTLRALHLKKYITFIIIIIIQHSLINVRMNTDFSPVCVSLCAFRAYLFLNLRKRFFFNELLFWFCIWDLLTFFRINHIWMVEYLHVPLNEPPMSFYRRNLFHILHTHMAWQLKWQTFVQNSRYFCKDSRIRTSIGFD